MKNTIKFLFILCSFATFAQSPVVSMESWNGQTLTAGSYLKDNNNRQDPYIGTWRFTQGNTSLTIVLRKYTMAFLGRTYRDILAGEYQYIENGVEKINTLPNLDVNLPNKWSHNIRGGSPLASQAYPLCPDCNLDEKRMSLSLYDPMRNLSARLTLRRINVNGVPALQMDLWGDGAIVSESDNIPEEDLYIHVKITKCVLLKVD